MHKSKLLRRITEHAGRTGSKHVHLYGHVDVVGASGSSLLILQFSQERSTVIS